MLINMPHHIANFTGVQQVAVAALSGFYETDRSGSMPSDLDDLILEHI